MVGCRGLAVFLLLSRVMFAYFFWVIFIERCEGGYLEWQVGPKRCDAHVATKLCGANERYSPPALLFSDSDATPATLLFK